jgi:hypothetical protein
MNGLNPEDAAEVTLSAEARKYLADLLDIDGGENAPSVQVYAEVYEFITGGAS